MAHILKIRRETAFRLDIGMADEIAYLWFLTAKFTFFTHIYESSFIDDVV